ncbi:GNAT family N-acetyltransferase [Halorarum halophilum]|uniref:GNAT family N-acetyltransferase n=1 Tax=Halorarum halophilum TaxID=2743090 RepID=A0A7D5GVS5_9EURY|nr:GNAT family protein [Halobaculum halophilum]QLG26349.1 GNAT family N-acetyltransferase [Halobaculum halophilum]
MFPERILTDRLRFDRHDAAVDALELYERTGGGRSDTVDEECEYLSWNPHRHPKESHDVLQGFRDQWEAHESATYAVFPREGEEGAGEFAGNTGVGIDWDTLTGTLGIWLRKPFWGRGYSGERALAFADLVFRRLDLDLLAAEVFPNNEKSVRAVEKYVDRMGGRREGCFRNHIAPDGDDPRDVVRFSVTEEEWRGVVGDEGVAEFVEELDG